MVCGACDRDRRLQAGPAHLHAPEKVGRGLPSPEGDVTSVAGDKGGMPLMTRVGGATDLACPLLGAGHHNENCPWEGECK